MYAEMRLGGQIDQTGRLDRQGDRIDRPTDRKNSHR
jgi:hypothetical protein